MCQCQEPNDWPARIKELNYRLYLLHAYCLAVFVYSCSFNPNMYIVYCICMDIYSAERTDIIGYSIRQTDI